MCRAKAYKYVIQWYDISVSADYIAKHKPISSFIVIICYIGIIVEPSPLLIKKDKGVAIG